MCYKGEMIWNEWTSTMAVYQSGGSVLVLTKTKGDIARTADTNLPISLTRIWTSTGKDFRGTVLGADSETL